MGELNRCFYLRDAARTRRDSMPSLVTERIRRVLEMMSLLRSCAESYRFSQEQVDRLPNEFGNTREGRVLAVHEQETRNLAQAAFELAFLMRQEITRAIDGLVIGDDARELGLTQDELDVLRDALGYGR